MPKGFKAGESRLVNRGDLVSFAKERRSKAKRALMSSKSRRVARGITRGNPRRKVFECRRCDESGRREDNGVVLVLLTVKECRGGSRSTVNVRRGYVRLVCVWCAYLQAGWLSGWTGGHSMDDGRVCVERAKDRVETKDEVVEAGLSEMIPDDLGAALFFFSGSVTGDT